MVRQCIQISCVLIAIGCSSAAAQQPATRPYDGIQAGFDAFQLAEERRQAAVGQQLFLNDQMRFWNGYPTSRSTAIYYGVANPTASNVYGYGPPLLTRANLDYVYGYGSGPLWGGSRHGWSGPLAVFEPWPYVPGDIWGYGVYYQPARQPIGQQQTQTGPNRWESHPIYDPPLSINSVTPPVDSPLLDRTPYATNRQAPATEDSIPPPPPKASSGPTAPRRGPREY